MGIEKTQMTSNSKFEMMVKTSHERKMVLVFPVSRSHTLDCGMHDEYE